ncbi:hypothetical protein BTA51_08470 [Hahella sp. CCB-MM4]|nr:hypothetical protein BTA51_08470 [Hahella sp. CCB-MM4]
MENTSQVLLRQIERLLGSVLLVCPPIDHCHAEIERTGRETTSICWDFQAFEAQHSALSGAARDRCQFGVLQAETDSAEFQHAVLFMPKSKEVIELYLSLLGNVLARAEKVWLVGEKREGIESAAKKLKKEGFGCIKLDSARHCQLWEISLSDNFLGKSDNSLGKSDNNLGKMIERSLDSYWQPFTLDIPGWEPLELHSLPGVFSAGRLDDGTRLLLECLQKPEFQNDVVIGRTIAKVKGNRILDFGCGCGVVGLSMKRKWPEAQVEMVDVNALALESTRRSAANMGLDVSVYASDGLSQVASGLAAIVTNPPFHQGVKQDTRTTRQFLQDCRTRLIPGGTLTLVANRFLPYADWIEDSLGNVSVIAEDTRYKVYHAKRQ